MLEEWVRAAAGRVAALWPEAAVYTVAIPQAAAGAYFVAAAGAGLATALAGRRQLTATVEVRYYLPETEAVAFGPWAERMLEGFTGHLVPAGGCPVAPAGLTAESAGDRGYYALRFSLQAAYRVPPAEAETMERLEQKIAEKETT